MTACIMSENIFDTPLFGPESTESTQNDPAVVLPSELVNKTSLGYSSDLDSTTKLVNQIMKYGNIVFIIGTLI